MRLVVEDEITSQKANFNIFKENINSPDNENSVINFTVPNKLEICSKDSANDLKLEFLKLNLKSNSCHNLTANRNSLQFSLCTENSPKNPPNQAHSSGLSNLAECLKDSVEIICKCCEQSLANIESIQKVIPLRYDDDSNLIGEHFCHQHTHDSPTAKSSQTDRPTNAAQPIQFPLNQLMSNGFELVAHPTRLHESVIESVASIRQLVCTRCHTLIGRRPNRTAETLHLFTSQILITRNQFDIDGDVVGQENVDPLTLINVAALFANLLKDAELSKLILYSISDDCEFRPIALIWDFHTVIRQYFVEFSNSDIVKKSIVLKPQHCWKFLFLCRGDAAFDKNCSDWSKDLSAFHLNLPEAFVRLFFEQIKSGLAVLHHKKDEDKVCEEEKNKDNKRQAHNSPSSSSSNPNGFKSARCVI